MFFHFDSTIPTTTSCSAMNISIIIIIHDIPNIISIKNINFLAKEQSQYENGTKQSKTDKQTTTHFTGIQLLYPVPNTQKITELEMCWMSYQNTKLKDDNQKKWWFIILHANRKHNNRLLAKRFVWKSDRFWR